MEVANTKEADADGKMGERSRYLDVDRWGKEGEIDLVEIAYTLLDKIHYIILWFLVGAVLLNAYAFFCIEPTYKSTAKMYVVSASKDSVVDLTDLNIGSSLTADYEQLILSHPVLYQVIDNLDLEMSTDGLAGMISLENPANTRILNVTVTSTNPDDAMNIANELVEVSVEYLPKTMSTSAPNIAQKALRPTYKANPSYEKYTLMGAIMGAALYCAWVIVHFLMDDTLRSMDDVERYFGVVPLTVIPNSEFFEDMEKRGNLHSTQKKKSRKRKTRRVVSSDL